MPIEVGKKYAGIVLNKLFQEYATHPLVHETNRHIAQKYLESSATGNFIGMTDIELKIQNFIRQQKVYSIGKLNKD